MNSAALATVLLAGAVGCNNLPGTKGQQGAAIGGLSGAAAGALVGGSHHRLIGALLGGALGAGGGYLIGAHSDKLTGHDSGAAQEAVKRAQANPATPEEARLATTADLNHDGFVTMDEVVAMKRAGFSDQEMLSRMQATGQIFELTPEQQNYLRTNGVDDYVIGQMPGLNPAARQQVLGQGNSVPSPTGGSAYPPAPVQPPAPSSSSQVPPPPGP